eukprot:1124962-Ditylum_brightwellii.AAC.1
MDKDTDKDNDGILVEKGTVQEQMREAGEKDIAERVLTFMTASIEFNLGQNKNTFRSRKELLSLVHKLTLADLSVYIKGRTSEEI